MPQRQPRARTGKIVLQEWRHVCFVPITSECTATKARMGTAVVPQFELPPYRRRFALSSALSARCAYSAAIWRIAALAFSLLIPSAKARTCAARSRQYSGSSRWEPSVIAFTPRVSRHHRHCPKSKRAAAPLLCQATSTGNPLACHIQARIQCRGRLQFPAFKAAYSNLAFSSSMAR